MIPEVHPAQRPAVGHVFEEMGHVLRGNDEPPWLDEQSLELLRSARETAHEVGLDTTNLLELDDGVQWFPWVGTRTMRTLHIWATHIGLACSKDILSLTFANEARTEIETALLSFRSFSAFHEAWPYWLYFCNLDVDTLRAMVLCCMPSTTTMQVDGQAQVKVTCEPLDVLNLLKRDFVYMNLLCERAEMFERLIYDRSKAVFEYFGLPFDAEPPPRPAKGHLCH